MIRTFIKTAFRKLAQNKMHTFINVAGLTVSISSCLLIILVVQFQSSFDNFHKNKTQIYRVASVFPTDNGIDYSGACPLPVANGIRIDFPEIKEIASVYRSKGQINIENTNTAKKFFEDNFFYVDPQFFDIFNFPFLKGDAATSLKNPNDAVLTKSAAEKYFGSAEAAIGKTFSFDRKNLYTVTGILKDVPANSDFPLNIVVPYKALESVLSKRQFTDWVSVYGDANTFLRLPTSITQQQMDNSLALFAKRHKPAGFQNDGLMLQSLSGLHFDKRFGNFNRKTFSHELIRALTIIGIFLIVIACINFINLATAQSVRNSKEIGIRKVLGSSKKQIAIQYLFETALVVIVAYLLAVAIAVITLPSLNRLLEMNIPLESGNKWIWISLLTTFIGTTLLAGAYPSFVVGNFNPVKAIKNKLSSNTVSGNRIRQGLVIFQFVIAQILIIGVVIVVSQMNYFQTADIGFNKESVINIRFKPDSTIHVKLDYFKQRLMANPDIKNVSYSFEAPSSKSAWQSDFTFDHREKPTNWSANLKWADADYFKLYDIKFIAGKPYAPADTVSDFVVNDKLINMLGITDPEKAIGKEVNFWNGELVGKISGVVKNFNASSLEEPMDPVVLGSYKANYRTASVKIQRGKDKNTIPYIEKEWNTTFPDYLFDYSFLDDKIADFYKTEMQLSQLYKIFAGIAIFISSLGLYGLVSFISIQRTKEIGIRKVLGASTKQIVFLLSREFTVLIIIAFSIATPLAWYIMNLWLNNYSYRIEIGPLIFVTAFFVSIFIAWITVGYRAVKAALSNPVNSLKTE